MLTNPETFKRRSHSSNSGRHSPEPRKSGKGASHGFQKTIGSTLHKLSYLDGRYKKTPENMVFGGKAHPMACGFEDKLYSKYDLTAPIIDSMSRLHSRSHSAGGLGRLLKSSAHTKTFVSSAISYSSFSSFSSHQQLHSSVIQDDDEMWSGGCLSMQRPPPPKPPLLATALGSVAPNPPNSQPGASASAQSMSFRSPILCEGCGTRDPGKMIKDEHAGEWVCECGVVGAKCPSRPDYKETNDTDNSKARADSHLVEKRKERFGHVPLNAPDQTRRIKESMGLVREPSGAGSVVPRSVEDNLKLRFSAKDSNHAAELPMGDEDMEKKYVSKLTAVIKEINSLIVQMAPVRPEVGRVIRMKTNRIYRDSYWHTKICANPRCHMGLVSKPARVIAHKSFVYTVEQLCKGGELADGVSKTQLTSLHERVSDSHLFRLRDNATQHEAVLAMIYSLDIGGICGPCDAVDNEAMEDDEHSSKTSKRAKSDSTQHMDSRTGDDKRIHRQDSDLQPSPIVAVREAVFKLSDQFGYSASVRDAAVDALGDREFASMIKNHTVMPSITSKFGKAYILLRSIKEEAEATSGSGSSNGNGVDHATHIQRVNLVNLNVDDMVSKMRRLLPNKRARGSVSSAHDTEGDDESFY